MLIVALLGINADEFLYAESDASSSVIVHCIDDDTEYVSDV